MFCIEVLLPRPAAAEPAHLWWAEKLVENVAPWHNTYSFSASYVVWAGVGGATRYANSSDCSGFLTEVLEQAYGWTDDDVAQWLDSQSPAATTYHDAILAGNGFDRITTVNNILPGDIIAIRYPDWSAVNGHVAIVRSVAQSQAPTIPLIWGTRQFAISIVDSSRAPHGSQDTRITPDGRWGTGVGFGEMRLYADSGLRIVGHTWSDDPGSTYRSQGSYHMVIGRLRQDAAP